MILKEQYLPSIEAKEEVKTIVETIKTATKEEVVEILIAALHKIAANQVIVEFGIERMIDLGVEPGFVAGIIEVGQKGGV